MLNNKPPRKVCDLSSSFIWNAATVMFWIQYTWLICLVAKEIVIRKATRTNCFVIRNVWKKIKQRDSGRGARCCFFDENQKRGNLWYRFIFKNRTLFLIWRACRKMAGAPDMESIKDADDFFSFFRYTNYSNSEQLFGLCFCFSCG